ncbi:MAG: hypothetical protein ABJI69_01085 [Balneola sp.]
MAHEHRGITITNITKTDIASYKIRITKDHKFLFPSEKIGEPITHDITVRINRVNYPAAYRIGSKDGKQRSGLLSLGSELYRDVLKISSNSTIKIDRTIDGIYLIRKL